MGRTIVVGAGLAGLSCANALVAQGLEVLVLEATSRVGGRIGSHRQDGFIIDAGFQVLFPAYPIARELLDLDALQLRPLTPGARVWDGVRIDDFLLDPLDAQAVLATLRLPWFTRRDQWLLAKLTLDVASLPDAHLVQPMGIETGTYWRRYGFSAGFVSHFLDPFFSGTFFDPVLATDASLFRYYWKMMALRGASIPALGMQAIPDQLASRLPTGALRLRTRVKALQRQRDGSFMVSLANGERLAAERVVLATALPELQRLSRRQFGLLGHGMVNLAFKHPTPLYDAPSILLNATPSRTVNQLAPASRINPACAPVGSQLSLVQVLGDPEASDGALVDRCRKELADIFPRHDFKDWEALRIDRIPYAQFRETPECLSQLPDPKLEEGLYLASEILVQSSIAGALEAGCRTAEMIAAEQHAKQPSQITPIS
ncbi:FAD-dependent oxidoreductase [bacterium]|nr:FAD-dependent oxidoreductase [bacterium]